jgi:microsomal epoxide hydrolase
VPTIGAITPFTSAVAIDDLRDLRDRLERARIPNQLAGAGWEYGTERGYLVELVAHWRDRYNWATHEARINRLGQFTTVVDGQPLHVVHQRSGRAGAFPLVLVHGWPGSIVEFLDVADLLLDPAPGLGSGPFDLVIPSLPGFGFSGPTLEPGWHPRRIAEALVALMARLGYERYGVQGGDWGSIVAANMADLAPGNVAGLHLNFLRIPRPRGDDRVLDAEEGAREVEMARWQSEETGYSAIQGTKPQTVGYALDDSPVGLCAWIVEKFRSWSDCGGDVERSFTKDQLLTNVSLYWLTRTATSAARIYYEMRAAGAAAVPRAPITVPTGVANYPAEVARTPRRWVERRYNLTWWKDQPRGGHFAAMEVPQLFAEDVAGFFATVR